MSRVYITRRIFDEAIALLEQAGLAYDHNVADTPLTSSQIRKEAAEAEALVCLLTDRIDAELMAALPDLKVVANVAVGYDNIDVSAASSRGILVTNTPDVLTECTADLTFALLLAAARQIVAADHYMRSGQFQGWELFQPHLGVDVYGKTLGIVGLGRIGAAVARRGALGFGMQVIYTANHPRPQLEKELNARLVPFPQLLEQGDFVSIHTPLTPKTHHLFTMDEFAQMKPTSILINTARGPIVDEADLVQALDEGVIGGAALDVFEEEPQMHPGLARLTGRTVVVPHIGSATVETRRRMSLMAVQNAISVLHGRPAPNAVNPEVWQP
jgi:glyoxylate reductase